MKFEARKENIAMQESGDETMIYDLSIDKAYLLNETSAFIWQMCDGNRDLAEISCELAEKTNQQVNEDVVKLAIEQLKTNNLLSDAENIKDFFTKTSRRKVIKQIGLGAMIALPVIFSLTSPTAAHAASLTAACQPCSNNAQCASGNCVSGSLCSNGSSTTSVYPAGYSGFAPEASAANCAATANPVCCTGASSFNPGTGACSCSAS